MMKLPTRHATSRLRVAGSRASRRGHECASDLTNRARAARGPTYLSGYLLPVCSLKRAIKFSVAGVCTSVCAALAKVPTY